MHQVFAIFLRDVKRILKNPVALVVTLGVAIIPSLYAWCNILANWDPYANTGNIQVAVANEDKGTTSTLVGHLDAGAAFLIISDYVWGDNIFLSSAIIEM